MPKEPIRLSWRVILKSFKWQICKSPFSEVPDKQWGLSIYYNYKFLDLTRIIIWYIWGMFFNIFDDNVKFST